MTKEDKNIPVCPRCGCRDFKINNNTFEYTCKEYGHWFSYPITLEEFEKQDIEDRRKENE